MLDSQIHLKNLCNKYSSIGIQYLVTTIGEGDGKYEASPSLIFPIPRRLVFDVGYNDYAVAPLNYTRGLDSDPDEYIQPSVEGKYILGQLTLMFNQRRYEAFIRGMTGEERLREVLDKDGNAFSDVDHSWSETSQFFIGGSIDFTDDRLDPRVGTRLETNIRLPNEE